jgi:hypothetical protein
MAEAQRARFSEWHDPQKNVYERDLIERREGHEDLPHQPVIDKDRYSCPAEWNRR